MGRSEPLCGRRRGGERASERTLMIWPKIPETRRVCGGRHARVVVKGASREYLSGGPMEVIKGIVQVVWVSSIGCPSREGEQQRPDSERMDQSDAQTLRRSGPCGPLSCRHAQSTTAFDPDTRHALDASTYPLITRYSRHARTTLHRMRYPICALYRYDVTRPCKTTDAHPRSEVPAQRCGFSTRPLIIHIL